MYKNIILFGVLLFLSNCNQHSNVTQLKQSKINNYVYKEKPFELKWKIEKDSITNIPLDVHKKNLN